MSYHSTGTEPTAVCPWCDTKIRLNKLGEFYMHRGRVQTRRGPRPGVDLCQASALTPVEAEREAAA